ncbi:MAG TPA: hypothetical protein VFA26_03055 [Gemmataceae bacterium]|nr:hypothetical protein [Gemmataceae bacterium]
MRGIRWALLPGLAGLLLLAAGPARSQDAKPVLKLVNYKELGEVIKALKGKVVVVDFWEDS